MAQTSTYKINVTEKGAKKAKKNINGLNNSLGGLAKKAGLAAAGFFGARMLLDGLKQAIDLSAKQELAEKKLEGALGKTSQALLDQASALQEVTKYGDEAIIEQQAFLASIGMTEEQIKSILPVAADLASATGLTLESAVRNTAKTFSGLAGELGELVPQVRDLTAEQMKSGEAVKVMGALFEGAASTEVNTMSGAMEQMNNAIGDAAENLGDLLGPTIISMAKGFKGAAEAVGAFLDRLKSVPTDEALATTSMDKLSKAIFDRKTQIGELTVSMGALFEDDATLGTRNRIAILQTELDAIQLRFDTLKEMSDEERQIFLQKEQDAERLRQMQEDDYYFNLENSKDLIIRHQTEAASFKKLEFTKISDKKKSYQLMLNMDKKLYEEQIKNQALGAASAREGMLNAVRAEIMKATSGYIAGLFTSLPPYVALPLAAGAGGLMNETITGLLNQLPNPTLRSFASGGSFVTSGAETIMVGDNPSGREIVSVTPLDAAGQPTTGGMITVNISGNVMSENYTEDVIVPHIKEALRRGEDIGIG